MKALEYITRGVGERERERESSGVEDSGELSLNYIEKFSIYRENKR